MNKVLTYFTNPFQHWYKVEVFRRVLYIFLFINTLTLIPAAYEIWGYEGVIGTRGWNFSIPTWQQGSYAMLNILSHPANAKFPWLYQIFIAGQIVFLLTGIFRILPKISSVMIYFFTTNLFLKGYLMFTGAEVLASILLFYLMFIQRKETKPHFKPQWKIEQTAQTEFSFLQTIFNNTFFIILLIQICIVYFFSTFYKLLDENWTSGGAVMYIARIDGYSSGMMKFIFADNAIISAVATYLILTYQGLFSLLVWFKKIKLPFLLFGVFFHLSIAFGMGIFTFGIFMCIVYLPFLDDQQLTWLQRKISPRKKFKSVS